MCTSSHVKTHQQQSTCLTQPDLPRGTSSCLNKDYVCVYIYIYIHTHTHICLYVYIISCEYPSAAIHGSDITQSPKGHFTSSWSCSFSRNFFTSLPLTYSGNTPRYHIDIALFRHTYIHTYVHTYVCIWHVHTWVITLDIFRQHTPATTVRRALICIHIHTIISTWAAFSLHMHHTCLLSSSYCQCAYTTELHWSSQHWQKAILCQGGNADWHQGFGDLFWEIHSLSVVPRGLVLPTLPGQEGTSWNPVALRRCLEAHGNRFPDMGELSSAVCLYH